MAQFRVGIDSYCLQPRKLHPLEQLKWAKAHGAEGVQFSGIEPPHRPSLDRAMLRDIAQLAKELDLYLEWGGAQHIPFDLETWRPKDIMPVNRRAAEQAAILGTPVIRSCSGGLMRWSDDAPPTETILDAVADALKPQLPMLADRNVTLALELHFEFTTFELLRLFDMCGAEPGGCLGICLDTMNLLTMLEDPLAGTERVLPWIVATHIKDGALRFSDDGLVSFTTEVGAGLVELNSILARLSTLRNPPNLSIEDHGGEFAIPIYDPAFLSRFPDLTTQEFARLVRLAREGETAIEAGRFAPLARADWPALCEQRVARGIANLQSIVRTHADVPA